MNDNTPSDALIEHIKLAEGYRSVPYTDASGFATWGYGHKARSGELHPVYISEEDASALLLSDVAIALQGVNECVQVDMTPDQFDALVDWTFNLGSGNLAGSTMLRRINAGDWEEAQAQCRRWVHNHAGAVLGGLVARREWDAQRMAPVTQVLAHDPGIVDPNSPAIPTLTDVVQPTPQQIEAAAQVDAEGHAPTLDQPAAL